MVRWPKGLHPQSARRGTNALAWRPGWRGTGQQPIIRPPLTAYRQRIASVPLTGGQAQGIVADGTLTLTVGPQAAGTVWYPVQITVSTTTGVLDTSTAQVYLGPVTTQATLVGSVYSGNGNSANVPAQLTPGQYVTVVWTGAHDGDTAAVNVTGTMSALTTGWQS